MAPTLRQLDLFRLLMQTRNVTETARLMGVSQPAASQMLKEFERQLGLKLFARQAGRITPTGEARILVQEVERLFQQFASLRGLASELRDATAGSLNVACIPALAGSLLPQAVAQFRAERPRVKVGMDAYDKAEILRLVRQDLVDLGILYGPVVDNQVATEPVMRTAMTCVLPQGHKLTAQRRITPRNLLDQTVIMHPSTSPSLLMQNQQRFEATLETNLSFGAISLVRLGVGIYVTEPVILLSGLAEGLPARPYEPEIPLELIAVYSRRRPVSRVLVRFVKTLRSSAEVACANLNQLGIPASLI